MRSILSDRAGIARVLPADLIMIACLIGLDVAARLVPHAPNFTPVAATALFAASVLRMRALAVLVPIAGMMLGDAMLGSYDARIMIAVYATLALPACAGALSRTLRRPLWIVPILVSSSLIFFLVTNLAVWAFGAMYPANAAGLLTCYVAALPFLRNMLAGDLFWGFALFGGYWLLQGIRAASAAAAAQRTQP